MNKLYDIEFKDYKGQACTLADYKDKVVLVVNTASACGFTPQYKGLEELYKKYQDKGFEILAFPCNQFGGQEPESTENIAKFCDLNFNISFKLCDKVKVNGSSAEPLFTALKLKAPGILGTKKIKWNFTKFLISRDGLAVKRFAPAVKPKSLESQIEKLL